MKILVPTDFGPASEAALALAIDLGSRAGAEVILAHAYGIPTYAFPSGDVVPLPRLAADLKHAARQRLERAALAAGCVRTVLREGKPANAILDLARELGVDLIVMGTHGRTGLSRILLGSVTEQVMRNSDVPVLTVRASRVRAGPRRRAA